MANPRTPLPHNITLPEFEAREWSKKVMMAYCKDHDIDASGNREEIRAKIIEYLKYGKQEKEPTRTPRLGYRRRNRNQEEPAKAEDLVPVNMKNTYRSRAFFLKELGPQFRFTRIFREFARQYQGQPYGRLVEAWKSYAQPKEGQSPQAENENDVEYQKFIHAYQEKHPDRTLRDAIVAWYEKTHS
ncbi:hypothetical protein SAMN05421823_109197 [Catalinimonas alkaloidigena]|uniref:DUF6434 domain-containing protein n=1 Tax=Catalinimonas alkaloidigena TaxID=1075417 RepID=A0A1G9PJ60_9BACT|nr:DUF6434 domain-containing protein [Catalinimonas alkaloidigena]SDL98247.1 hypothetical protein SAMN05421823_109197 [Catalinimonas alkaloidigena]